MKYVTEAENQTNLRKQNTGRQLIQQHELSCTNVI